MKKFLFILMLVLTSCELNPVYDIPPDEDPMGTVNLANLYGTPSCNRSLYNPTTYPLSNINDNDFNSYAQTKDTVQSFLYSKVTNNTTFTITLPAEYLVTSITVKGYAGCNVQAVVYLITDNISFGHFGSVNIVYNTTSSKYFNKTVTVDNLKMKKIDLSYSVSSDSFLLSAHAAIALCTEIAVYGPNLPDSGVKFYKDQKYSLAEDVDNVSPLIIGGQRIALGSTSNSMATPLRYYDDGDTYAILKAQGT